MRVRHVVRVATAVLGAYAAYAWFAQRRFEDLDPETAGAPGAFIDVDGVRVQYVDAGRGDPIVLIHGWNGSTFSFRYTIPELARTHRVIAIDLLGFGYSARPAHGDYSVTAQVRLVAGLLDPLGIERAVIVGHSMGGGIAMHLALAYPERVEQLVLVDSVSVGESRRALRTGKLLRHALFLLTPVMLYPARMRKAALHSAVHDPALLTDDVLNGHLRPMRMKGHLRGISQQMRDRGKEPTLDPAKITQRTLILWGEHDRVIPLATGQDLAQRVPGARLEVVRGAGHLPLEEQPETCNRMLLEFLDPPQAAAASTAGAAVQLEPRA